MEDNKKAALKEGLRKLRLSRETNEDTANPLARPFHERVCLTDSAGSKKCNSFAADEPPSLFGKVGGVVYDDTEGKGSELEGRDFEVDRGQEAALKMYLEKELGQKGDYDILNSGTIGDNCRGYSKRTFKTLEEFLKK